MEEVDYLVFGAGIESLSFVNTILEGSDARIAIVDNQDAAGGHWAHLPDFSSVAQPHSAFGISPMSIRDWRPDIADFQRDTVLAYASHILEHRLMPTGRISYFPKHTYLGNGEIRSVESGQTHDLAVKRSVVNAAQIIKPMTGSHIPCFSCTAAVAVIHPRDLTSHHPLQDREYDAYCILGAGRTATDTTLHMLSRGIPPDQIRWVKTRERWVLTTPQKQASPVTFDDRVAMNLESLRLMSRVQTPQEFCLELERLGFLDRTSSDLEPHGFSPQVITPTDAARLRTIQRVVRKGHVHAISELGMVLDEGAAPMPSRTLYIDCTGSTGEIRKPPPIFRDNVIHLAETHLCQPSFSAAMIGATERLDLSNAEKNALCAPLHGTDIVTLFLTNILNQHAWFHHDALRKWMEACRLDGFLQSAACTINSDRPLPRSLQVIRTVLPRAIINLELLLEQSGATDPLLD